MQSANGPRTGYVFAEHKANIIAALNEYGKAVNDAGLRTGCISTPGPRSKHARKPTTS